MGRVALLDTSVVVALLDADDPHHAAARTAFEADAGDSLAISVITYSELMVGALRAGGDYPGVVEGFIDDATDAVEPVTRAIAGAAAGFRAAHRGLKLPDALIIATAEAIDAARILTADARWEGVSERIELLEGTPRSR